MRTSRRMLRQVRRALLVAFLFSAGINVLMLALPLYTLQIFDTVVPSGSIETLVVLSAMAGAALLAQALVEICRDRIMLRAGLWLDHMLGQHMLENGIRSLISAPELRAHAKALSTFRGFLVSGGMGPLFDLPWVPAFLLILFALNPLIGLFACAIAGTLLVAALLLMLVTSRSQTESARALERSEHWWGTVAGNAQLAGAMGLASGAAAQWELFNRAHVAGSYTTGKRSSFIRALVRMVRSGGQIGLYGLGAWLVIAEEMQPGVLVAAVIILSRMISPLEQLVSSLRNIQVAVKCYRQLKSLPADAALPRVADGEGAPLGRVVLADVSYFHPGRKTPALRGVSIVLDPGECIGIAGPNGSGKSTLAAMLAGAIAPASGAADLDGVPIVKWQRGVDEPPVGYLPDDAQLIEGSVHDNIARFRPASLAGVANAALRAGVHDTLSGLANGYDTEVGPNGAGLALRERRAVALARAVFGSPKLIVLDEPELGLDGRSLKQLSADLKRLKADGIGLAIATQDPRLLALADKLVVLNGGQVQAFGTRDEVAQAMGGADRAAVPAPLKQVV